MFEEMRRTLNAVGDYSDSEGEYETDSDTVDNNTTTTATVGKVNVETTPANNSATHTTTENNTNADTTKNNKTGSNGNGTPHNNITDETNGEQGFGGNSFWLLFQVHLSAQLQLSPHCSYIVTNMKAYYSGLSSILESSKIDLSYTQPPPGSATEETIGEPEKAKKKKRKKTKKAKIELEDYLACEDATDPQAENPYDMYVNMCGSPSMAHVFMARVHS